MEAHRQETSFKDDAHVRFVLSWISADPPSPEILTVSLCEKRSHKLDRETGQLVIPHLGRIIYMIEQPGNTIFVFHEGLSTDNPQAYLTHCDADYKPIGRTSHLGSLTDFYEKMDSIMNRTLETLLVRS